VLSDSNPAHVVSGGVIHRDGTAEVRGEIQCTEQAPSPGRYGGRFQLLTDQDRTA